MNKLLLLIFTVLSSLIPSALFAAAGDIDVTLESSSDLSSWNVIPEGVRNIASPPEHFRVKIVPADGGDPSYSAVETASPSNPDYNTNVGIESSADLASWADSVVGTQNVSGAKKFWRANVRSIYADGNDGKVADMVTVPAGTTTTPNITIDNAFLIGRYEVSKEEWDAVHDWAINTSPNTYVFYIGLSLADSEGCAPNHPVTKISWFDAVKWCNALSEKEGLTPVYYTDANQNIVYRDENIFIQDSFINTTADGYRLPWKNEWQYAAAGGGDSPVYIYSGSDTVGEVAIYDQNSTGADCIGSTGTGTFPLASKAPNYLGIFDMSGNVSEYVNDYEGETIDDRKVRIMGGHHWSFDVEGGPLTVAGSGFSADAIDAGDESYHGFRLARTLPAPAAVQTFSAAETTTTFSRSSTSRRSNKDKRIKLVK